MGCGGGGGGGPITPSQTCNDSGGRGSGTGYSVTVNVAGLPLGASVTLNNSNCDTQAISGTGQYITYSFATELIQSTPYSVTVTKQPTGYFCSVPAGATSSKDVIVPVSCSPSGSTGSWTLGGSVSGLATGQSVSLLNNGANSLTLNANSNFTFSGTLSSGSAYSVTVGTQPTGQTCMVNNGTGTISASVSNIQITCSTSPPLTLGGTVTGLDSGKSVSLLNNGANPLTVSANSSFTFSNTLTSGSAYAVTVGTQPTGQTCTVTNGSGTITGVVSNIQVTCTSSSTPPFSLGGTVSGLSIGKQVVLQNGSSTVTVNANAVGGNVAYVFPVNLAKNDVYAVTVATQPVGLTCTVSNGTGSGVVALVSNANVTCSSTTFTVGGTVSGLTSLQQLTLLNNSANQTNVSGNGAFTFSTSVAANSSYNVTVGSQPSAQTCTVSKGAGAGVTANVSDVSVICSSSTTIPSGTISGLNSGQQVTLKLNNANPIVVSANGSFNFTSALAQGSTYLVTVGTQPIGQVCSVNNSSGTVGASVSTIQVICSAMGYTVSGSASGLTSGTQVTLLNNGSNPQTVTSTSGPFTFDAQIATGGSYAVTVGTQPTGMVCSVSNASGTITGFVTNVSVSCVSSPGANSRPLGFTVTGLGTGKSLTLTNYLMGTPLESLPLSGNTTSAFVTQITVGSTYNVAVSTQPVGQTCTVTNGAGTMTTLGATLAVACADTTYPVNVTVTGLGTGKSVVLKDNLTDSLTVSTNSTTVFGTRLTSGATYSVTVGTQPTNQTCTVTNGAGTMTTLGATVAVSCADNYALNATVTGLGAGKTLTLISSPNDSLAINFNSTTAFANRLTSGSPYSVSVGTQPTNQTCTVTNGTGIMTALGATVTVACADNYPINVTVSGMAAGRTIYLTNNFDSVMFSANTTATLPTRLTIGSAYNVSLGAQSTGQTCTITNGTGLMTASGANVTVTCAETTYPVNVTVTGLGTGKTLTLSNNLIDNLVVSTNTTTPFANRLLNASAYNVTVTAQPSGQTCTVSNGSGTITASAATVTVTCADTTYPVTVAVTGLGSSKNVILKNNLTDSLTFTTNTSTAFATRLTTGSAYSVTVGTQPTNQTCTVTNGAGTMASSAVTLSVACADNYPLNVSVTGLGVGKLIIFKNNLIDTLTAAANTIYTFTTRLVNLMSFSVTVDTQPTNQTCTVTNSTGTMTTSGATVSAVCADNYPVNVTVTGLGTGKTLVLSNTPTDSLTFSGNTTTAFTKRLTNASSYSVAVTTQPTDQTCTVTNGTGLMTTSGASVSVACTVNTYPVNVTVTGLGTGKSVILKDNLTDTLTLTTNTTTSFTTRLTSGSTYSVTVGTLPSGQTCTVANGSGTMASPGANVTVVCGTNVVSLSIPSTSGPWLVSANPSKPYSSYSASAPVVVLLSTYSLTVGNTIYLKCTGGSGGFWTADHPCISDVMTNINTTDNPTYYIPGYADPDHEAQIIGVFANSSGVVIGSPFIISEITKSVVIPSGATRIQFGINDNYHADNTGTINMLLSY